MRAKITHANNLALSGAPENQLFSQAGNTNRFARRYFLAFQDCIPLIADHSTSTPG
jgi:hypothetical protein